MGDCYSSCCGEASDSKMDKNQIMVDITTKSTLYKIDGILSSKPKDTDTDDKSKILLYPSLCSVNIVQSRLLEPHQILTKISRNNRIKLWGYLREIIIVLIQVSSKKVILKLFLLGLELVRWVVTLNWKPKPL